MVVTGLSYEYLFCQNSLTIKEILRIISKKPVSSIPVKTTFHKGSLKSLSLTLSVS